MRYSFPSSHKRDFQQKLLTARWMRCIISPTVSPEEAKCPRSIVFIFHKIHSNPRHNWVPGHGGGPAPPSLRGFLCPGFIEGFAPPFFFRIHKASSKRYVCLFGDAFFCLWVGSSADFACFVMGLGIQFLFPRSYALGTVGFILSALENLE